jgi:hypothetical protein
MVYVLPVLGDSSSRKLTPICKSEDEVKKTRSENKYLVRVKVNTCPRYFSVVSL